MKKNAGPDIDETWYSGIARLRDNYVYLQPRQGNNKIQSGALRPQTTGSERALRGRTTGIGRSENSIKGNVIPPDKKELLLNQLAGLIDATIKRIKPGNISGEIDKELIFELAKVHISSTNKDYWFFFQPSEELYKASDIWMLTSIFGEDHFLNSLAENYFVVNQDFVDKIFVSSKIVVYTISGTKHFFAANYPVYSAKFGTLMPVKISEVKERLTLEELELLFEKGEITLN